MLIYLLIHFVFYIIGAYATTDILRLLRGCSTPINASNCYCPQCDTKITLKNQIPIISYVKNHGACATCKAPIPATDLFLEIFLFTVLSAIAFLGKYGLAAYLICVITYELTKIVFIAFYGPREAKFGRNLLCSLFNNLLIFLLVGVLFLVVHIG